MMKQKGLCSRQGYMNVSARKICVFLYPLLFISCTIMVNKLQSWNTKSLLPVKNNGIFEINLTVLKNLPKQYLTWDKKWKQNSFLDVYTSTTNNKKYPVHKKVILNSTKKIIWYRPSDFINVSVFNILISEKCVYSNCEVTSDESGIMDADAIIFQPDAFLEKPPVSRKERKPDQVWIFFYSEAPVNHLWSKKAAKHWRRTMNWSMSYELDADIFEPYGLLERQDLETNKNYSAIFRRKTKMAAWAVSHCDTQSKRRKYVSKLRDTGIQIDVFGKCGDKSMPTHEELYMRLDNDYKFYLSFENSFCKDYVTEKFFTYYSRNVVLVVRGGLDYNKTLPNGTFINTANFNSASDLAQYLQKVSSSEQLYTEYLRAKDKYKNVYYPLEYCRLCEMLDNLHEHRNMYEDHIDFMHKDKCWNASDIH